MNFITIALIIVVVPFVAFIIPILATLALRTKMNKNNHIHMRRSICPLFP